VTLLPFFGNRVTAMTHFPARLAAMAVPENEQDAPPEIITMRMDPCDVFGMVILTACATRDAATLAPRFRLNVLITTAGAVPTVLEVVGTALLTTGGGVVFTASEVVVVVAGRVVVVVVDVVVVGITFKAPTVTALVSTRFPELEPV
jgi:hypothetical protein